MADDWAAFDGVTNKAADTEDDLTDEATTGMAAQPCKLGGEGRGSGEGDWGEVASHPAAPAGRNRPEPAEESMRWM